MIAIPPAIICQVTDADLMRLIRAIGAVESGNDDTAVGSAGERGRYQITRALWRTYAAVSFDRAFDERASTVTMFRILDTWTKQLRARGIPEDLMSDVLSQWFCCGQSKVPSPQKADEIKRILNLYREDAS